MKYIKAVLSYIPFVYLIATLSNMLYLSVVTVLPGIGWGTPSTLLHIALFIATALFFLPYRHAFDIDTITVKKVAAFFLLFFSVYLLRAPLYYPSHDDIAFHIPAAFYAQSPFDFSLYAGIIDYKYAALDLNNYLFLTNLGIRATLFLNGVILSIWSISLIYRVSRLVGKYQRWSIALIMVFIYFFPQVIATHVSFMTDVFNLLLIIEAYYHFMRLISLYSFQSVTYTLIITGIAMVAKQSNIVLLPIWLYMGAYPFYLLIREKESRKSIFKAVAPVFIVALLVSIYFIRTTLESNIYTQYIYHLDRVAFGPYNFIETLLWPVIGPFTTRYSEIYTAWYTRLAFSFIIWALYLYLIFRLLQYLTKFKVTVNSVPLVPIHITLLLLSTYLFWSVFSGYGRYIVPLHAISLLSIVFFSRKTSLAIPKFIYDRAVLKVLIYAILILFSFSSIKSDYGWRPYPSFKNPESTRYFMSEYTHGWQLVFNDTIHDIAKVYQPLFTDVDAVMPTRYGISTFVMFLGGVNNKPTIDDLYKEEVADYKKGKAVSPRMEHNIKTLEKTNSLLIASEKQYTEYFSKLYISNLFDCKKITSSTQVQPIQSEVLNTVELYKCIRKKQSVP